MKKSLRRTFVPVVAAVAALTLAGCGAGEKAAQEAGDKLVEKALESEGEDVDVDSSDGNVKVETEDGTATYGDNVDLPDGFPDDVPLPQGEYSIVSAITSGTTITVTMTMAEIDFDAEKAHIESGFADAGYEVANSTNSVTADSSMLIFEATKGGTTVSFMMTADSTSGGALNYTVDQG